jgi:hypothetical protein
MLVARLFQGAGVGGCVDAHSQQQLQLLLLYLRLYLLLRRRRRLRRLYLRLHLLLLVQGGCRAECSLRLGAIMQSVCTFVNLSQSRKLTGKQKLKRAPQADASPLLLPVMQPLGSQHTCSQHKIVPATLTR